MKVASLGFIVKDGKVLLGEKKHGAEIGSGMLNGAGGKLEEGETIDECLIRETQEEFGIIPRTYEKVAVIIFFAAGEPQFEVHVYLIEDWSGLPIETSEMFEAQWYPLSMLPYDRMHEGNQHWLEKIFSGEKFRANIYYQTPGEGFISDEYAPFA